MNQLIDTWLTSGLWQMGIWSLRWAVLIMLLMAWFAIRPPRTAAVRILVARMVLAGGLLLPLVPSFWGPTLTHTNEPRLAEPPVATRVPTAGMHNVNEARPARSAYEKLPAHDLEPRSSIETTAVASRPAVPTSARKPVPQTEPLGWSRRTALVLAITWLIGALVGLSRLAIGAFCVRRLRLGADVVTDAGLRAEFDRCREQLGVIGFVQLATHSGVHSPILVGRRRPWILVPTRWAKLSVTARRAILLHELAHVWRNDVRAKLTEELVRVVFFFHPLVHWLLACIGTNREELCDATVVHHGVTARELAGVLLDCCRACGAGRPVLALRLAALPFFRRKTVKDRIQTLMEEPSMSRWKLQPSRLSVVSMFMLMVGIAAVVGGFGARAADSQQPSDETVQAAGEADLPTIEQIQAGYRANFAKLMPMVVKYRVLKSEREACIEADRRRLKSNENLVKLNRTDIKIDGQVYFDEAQFALLLKDTVEQNKYLKASLEPHAIKRRLRDRIEERCYFWTDGESFHARWPNVDTDMTIFLENGAVSPAENLASQYSDVMVASWSKNNEPPLRCWFGGGGGGRVSNALNDCFSKSSLAPLGFVRHEWTHKHDWHDLDRFMSEEPGLYEVVRQEDLEGRSTILVEAFFTPPAKNGTRERTRAWIDPGQGFLPLRLEWDYVNSSGKGSWGFHRYAEVADVINVAGGFYPARFKRQEYIYDYKANEKHRQEKEAGRVPEDAPLPLRAPGKSRMWEVTEIVPQQPIEPAALLLEFPKGTLYANAIDKRMYHAGDPKPLPLAPKPLQPGQVAPPLEVAQWTDGKSRNLSDFRGKVVVLTISQRLDDENDGDADENGPIIASMKELITKHMEQGVVFLEIFGAGSDVEIVRKFQKATGWGSLAGIDEGPRYSDGATLQKYGEPGFAIIGRDGHVAFNLAAQDEEGWYIRLSRAAKALSIPWPLDEDGPAEQIGRQQLQLFTHIMSDQIDRALAEPAPKE